MRWATEEKEEDVSARGKNTFTADGRNYIKHGRRTGESKQLHAMLKSKFDLTFSRRDLSLNNVFKKRF